jgi:tight adherence protein C
MLIALTAAFFVVTLAAVGFIGYLLVSRTPAPATAGPQAPPDAPRWVSALVGLADVSPQRVPNGELRRKLRAAGLRQNWAAHAYHGLRTTMLIVIPAAVFLGTWLFSRSLGSTVAPTVLAFALALRIPDRYLRKRIEKRRAAINRALPDFLDLLVIGVESGLSLDQAISDTARDLRNAHPVLWEELNMFRNELIAGASRPEALRNLGERSGEPELRKLTSLLIQADRFGASVTKVLRTQARYMRIRRRQAAEEQAHKMSVKLLFPIFFLIMPSVFLVAAGPAVILLIENFGAMAEGR